MTTVNIPPHPVSCSLPLLCTPLGCIRCLLARICNLYCSSSGSVIFSTPIILTTFPPPHPMQVLIIYTPPPFTPLPPPPPLDSDLCISHYYFQSYEFSLTKINISRTNICNINSTYVTFTSSVTRVVPFCIFFTMFLLAVH